MCVCVSVLWRFVRFHVCVSEMKEGRREGGRVRVREGRREGGRVRVRESKRVRGREGRREG